jgi:hypothetical protein
MQYNAGRYMETMWLQNVIEREPIEVKADRRVNVKWIVKI